MSRYSKRIDANQPQLDALARRLGAHVIPCTSAPELGFDRLWVRGGQVYIVEIKDPSQDASHRQLTEGEARRKAQVEEAGGQYHIIQTDQDVLKLFGLA